MSGDFRILIIDDQRPNLDLMEQLLAREGLTNVLSSTEPLRTLDLFNSFEPDLVVLDLHMPDFDGFAVLEQLNRRIPANDYLPIMVLTATRHGIRACAPWHWRARFHQQAAGCTGNHVAHLEPAGNPCAV